MRARRTSAVLLAVVLVFILTPMSSGAGGETAASGPSKTLAHHFFHGTREQDGEWNTHQDVVIYLFAYRTIERAGVPDIAPETSYVTARGGRVIENEEVDGWETWAENISCKGRARATLNLGRLPMGVYKVRFDVRYADGYVRIDAGEIPITVLPPPLPYRIRSQDIREGEHWVFEPASDLKPGQNFTVELRYVSSIGTGEIRTVRTWSNVTGPIEITIDRTKCAAAVIYVQDSYGNENSETDGVVWTYSYTNSQREDTIRFFLGIGIAVLIAALLALWVIKTSSPKETDELGVREE